MNEERVSCALVNCHWKGLGLERRVELMTIRQERVVSDGQSRGEMNTPSTRIDGFQSEAPEERRGEEQIRSEEI